MKKEGVSRQRRWQLKKSAQGLCQICGDAPILSAKVCARHYLDDRERGRAKRRALGIAPVPQRGRPCMYTDALLLALSKEDGHE